MVSKSRRLLPHRSVKPPCDVVPIICIPTKKRIDDPIVVWDESGFSVGTKDTEMLANPLKGNIEAKRGIRTDLTVSTKDVAFSESTDDQDIVHASGHAAKVIYSEFNATHSTDAWLGHVYTVSNESSNEVRREVSRLILRSLLSCDEEESCLPNHINGIPTKATDRYTVRRKPENQADRYGVPGEIHSSTTVSPMATSRSVSIAMSFAAADEIERDRQRIRDAIVKSMSVGTDEGSPKSGVGTSKVGSFWHSIGLSCFATSMSPTPTYPANRTISWVDSVSLSTLSH